MNLSIIICQLGFPQRYGYETNEVDPDGVETRKAKMKNIFFEGICVPRA